MQLTTLLLAATAATAVAAGGFHLVTLHRAFRDQKQSDEEPELKGIPIPNSKRSSSMSRRNDLISRKDGGPEQPVTTTIHFEHERVAVLVPANHFDCSGFLKDQNRMTTVKDAGEDIDFTTMSGFYGNCGAKKLNFFQNGDVLEVFEDTEGTKYADCFRGTGSGSFCVDTFLERTSWSDTWVCPSFLCANN
ncbi:hypothetical protein BKA64DRAFT_747814 [Cadophora sp. MPI-SDFR-AT-0126]|nr:hypothetical protein BKA64DRAFT_747814 [Leotiomycetes sp. MPI-SDFR-AT-0126]